MIKYLNQKPKLYIVTSLFISIALILFAISFNVVYGRGAASSAGRCGSGYTFTPSTGWWGGGTCTCTTQTSCNKCGQCNTCDRAYETTGRWGGRTCVSPTCSAPVLQPPQPFECRDVDVSYIERLSQYNINGLHASITSNGKYTVKGMTTHGSQSCDDIKKAISSFNYNSCAYPSSVSEERLERVSWSFNNMTTVKDCGNVKGVYGECKNEAVNFGAYPGFTTIGAIASPYQAFKEHSTVLQNEAPNQYRWGKLKNYGISSSNTKPEPYPVTRFYNTNNHETLKLAFNYEMVYNSLYKARPCWKAFSFIVTWRECHRVHYFTYTPRVVQPNIALNSYQVRHRDRNQLIFRNSPIRKSWQLQNANSGSCNIETKNSDGNVISALSRSAIDIDPSKNQQTVDFLPINGATGQYLENVDKSANYTIGYDPSRIETGVYTSLLSCNLSINCSAGGGIGDDCKRTYPTNPYTNGVNVSASTSFTISPDITVNLKAVAKPSIVSKKNIRTKIEATTTGARSGDKHKYKITKLPQGYRLTSNPEIVINANVAGSSTVSWDVVLDINPNTNLSDAEIGTSQFVIEMIDEPYDNLYTAKAQVTYLGSRDIKEVAP